MATPFFPAWRARLAAFGQQARVLSSKPLPHLEKLFASLLPPGLLAQSEEGTHSRDRIYSLRTTFWAFLWQALNPSAPCREAVRQIQALHCLAGSDRPVDESTSAFCQARARLPLDILQRVRQSAADHAEKLISKPWHGWRPKVVDGTTLSLNDTPSNQATYPQSANQSPGCGFPLLKMVGVFCLGSGALLGYAKGNKHQSELALLFRLRKMFQSGDLLLADRGFASYVLMALLELVGVPCVFRLHGSRPDDMRKGLRLGKKDRLLIWSKPPQKPRYLPVSLWRRVPAELTVRVLQYQINVPGFRTKKVTLMTSLSDAQAYPAAELAELYSRRWKIELWWRDLKTSMGMEVLRCRTPAMIHKELEMYLIGYNLIRGLMAEAAVIHDQPLEQISFKGSVDAVRQFSPLIATTRSSKKQKKLVRQLLQTLARDLVPVRPGRYEPRAVKRRPKPYPLLNKPRSTYHKKMLGKKTPKK
jgi:hypothetical protein